MTARRPASPPRRPTLSGGGARHYAGEHDGTSVANGRGPLSLRLVPLTLLALVQAVVVACLLREHRPLPTGHAAMALLMGHGEHGRHGSTPLPAPVGTDPVLHHLGLAALGTVVALPLLCLAVTASRRLLARWRVNGELLSRAVFACFAGLSGLGAAAVTAFLAAPSLGNSGSALFAPTVCVLEILRNSFVSALVLVLLIGVPWHTRATDGNTGRGRPEPGAVVI